MAAYWDYPTSTTGYWPMSTNTGGTTSSIPTMPYRSATAPYQSRTYTTTGTSTTPVRLYVTYVREYVVKLPEHYSKGDVADLVYLINDATKTGFIVKMVFNDDDVQITDPNVEKRDLEDFIPLLLRAATSEDQQIIRDFFVAHPITTPETSPPTSTTE